MKTQKIQLVHNLPYKNSEKQITIARVLFNKEYTKVDFGFNPAKIQLIKNNQIRINPNIYIRTKNNNYQIKSAQIYQKPFFKKDMDYKYFSLLFEPIDEDIEQFNIVDLFENKELIDFNFETVLLKTTVNPF